MPEIIPSLACNLDADILTAALPLFSESRVGGIEWSFDTLYQVDEVPDWFTALLAAYSAEGRLVGHGVFFSLFSGRWTSEQQKWLNELTELSVKYHFDHITEHFGFMTGKNFHHGAPLTVPYSKTSLAIGRDRLTRIYDACGCPVGLENLAFSYTLDEVRHHGEFLERLVEPVNGFIILDLHNLYCQLHNFSVDFDTIISLYPLDRVREIHISGGSWDDSLVSNRKVRRDTHDSAVPKEVFNLLKLAIGKCPNLKYVVLEQLGIGLKTSNNKINYYQDFRKMESIVKKENKKRLPFNTNSFLPLNPKHPGVVLEDEQLYIQQLQLSTILNSAISYLDAAQQLAASTLANSEWKIEEWKPHMLETAIKIAKKWKAPSM